MGKFNRLRSYELMLTFHIGYIEFKLDVRPLVWYMPFLVYSKKVKRNRRVVDGGNFNFYFGCFRLWTFRTSYLGVGLDLSVSKNPFFGRLTPWRVKDIVVFDLQGKLRKEDR